METQAPVRITVRVVRHTEHLASITRAFRRLGFSWDHEAKVWTRVGPPVKVAQTDPSTAAIIKRFLADGTMERTVEEIAA